MTKRAKILFLSGLGLAVLIPVTVLALQIFAVRSPLAGQPTGFQVNGDGAAAFASDGGLEDGEVFILREFNGYIAIFRFPEVDHPDVITSIDTRTLRRVDYLEMQTGIRVEGWENLQRMLEDFGP